MAVKQVELPELGTVKLYKRKGTRSIKLSVTSTGEIRVSLPYWLPFEAGAKFAASKRAWIQTQLHKQTTLITHGQAIGKSHHIYFTSSAVSKRVSTRIESSSIKITYPEYQQTTTPEIQKAATSAAIRALRAQATTLLPQRLRTLALTHELPYRSVHIKRLKGRWGSCDTDKNIVLNLFLMQLPWHLIDYVLLHELTHTRVLHHGADFWEEFETHLPNAKQLRRDIRNFRPAVEGNFQFSAPTT